MAIVAFRILCSVCRAISLFSQTRRWLFHLPISLVIASVLLFLSWPLRHHSPLSSIFIEIGAGVALFAVLFLVEHHLLVRHIRAQDERHSESLRVMDHRVSDLESDTESIRLSVDDLRKNTQERIDAQRSDFTSKLDRLNSTVSFDDLFFVLRRSLERNETSVRGVRVGIHGQWERLAFRAREGSNSNTADDIHSQKNGACEFILIEIEHASGNALGSITWASGESPHVAFSNVAVELQKLGYYPGDTTFDPASIVKKLVYTLRIAHERRSRGGIPDYIIGPVIEIPWLNYYLSETDDLDLDSSSFEEGHRGPQWLISDHGLESIEYPYTIDSSRVHEDNWASHMAEKMWVDKDQFQHALIVARAVFSRFE